jgi:hypothetical protein
MLKGSNVNLRIAEGGEINSAEATIASLSVTKWPGALPSPGVLFGDDSIVDQASPRANL